MHTVYVITVWSTGERHHSQRRNIEDTATLLKMNSYKVDKMQQPCLNNAMYDLSFLLLERKEVSKDMENVMMTVTTKEIKMKMLLTESELSPQFFQYFEPSLRLDTH